MSSRLFRSSIGQSAENTETTENGDFTEFWKRPEQLGFAAINARGSTEAASESKTVDFFLFSAFSAARESFPFDQPIVNVTPFSVDAKEPDRNLIPICVILRGSVDPSLFSDRRQEGPQKHAETTDYWDFTDYGKRLEERGFAEINARASKPEP